MDQVVDSAANAAIMSLLDCFSGYHQCWMAKEDEEKTSFITPFGTFCFVRMPEGLKNAGSTFTRMTGTVFKPQIGKNIQAYVDDLIVKSSSRANHVSDLAETFANMRWAGLKLNPEKCVFGVTKKNFGMPHLRQKNRSQPRQDKSNQRNGGAQDEEGHSETEWSGGSFK
jgi:hypothetical protein